MTQLDKALLTTCSDYTDTTTQAASHLTTLTDRPIINSKKIPSDRHVEEKQLAQRVVDLGAAKYNHSTRAEPTKPNEVRPRAGNNKRSDAYAFRAEDSDEEWNTLPLKKKPKTA